MNALPANANGSARHAGNVVAFPARSAVGAKATDRSNQTGNQYSVTQHSPPHNGQNHHNLTQTDLNRHGPVRREQFHQAPRRQSLLTLSVDHAVDGVGHFTRLMSVSSTLSIADLVEAILCVYEWPDLPDSWLFRTTRRGRSASYAPGALGPTEQLLGVRSSGTPVAEALGRGGVAQLRVGEFSFLLQVTDVVAGEALAEREMSEDPVLLTAEFLPAVDGNGVPLSDATLLHPKGIPASVNVSEINIALAGADTVEEVLSFVQPELRELLQEGELFEFVPLLQALDLERPANVSEHAAELLADAPVEEDALGRVAAWARIIALSTLVDPVEVDRVSESFMEATCPGEGLVASDIKDLSRQTGRLLALAGADGWQARAGEPTPLVPRCSMVERLEMYRFLLQR